MRFTRIFQLALLLSTLTLAIAAQKPKPLRRPLVVPGPTVRATETTPGDRRIEAFHAAWSTINQNYYDKTFGGLDWNKIRTEFQPRVAAAKTDTEFHRLLSEMIARLGRSHLTVIVPEFFERLENAKVQARIRGKQMAVKRSASGTNGAGDPEDEPLGDPAKLRYGIGVELRMIDNQIVITQVEKQSGATIAGLKPGFVLDKVNGVSIRDLIDKATLAGTSKSDIRYLLPLQLVEFFLNGEPETSVFLTCLDGADRPLEFAVPPLELPGTAVSISQNLPDQFLNFQSVSLTSDIGYIKFNAFAVPVIEKFCESLTSLGPKKALIIDLRGNLGGILASMIGLSGMISEKALTLGTYTTRTQSAPFIAAAKAKNFKGRVVVLVDALSMSAAELFAAGLQGNQRAIVVGDRTGGQALPANWTKLSTGALLVYPVANFITPKGVSLEGSGLEPDFAESLDRKSLLGGVDRQLQKAVAVIGDDAAFARLAAPVHSNAGPSTGNIPPPPAPKAIAKTPNGNGIVVESKPLNLTRIEFPSSDAHSLQIVADYANAVGGVDALKNVKTYEVTGRASIGKGGEAEGTMYAARELPDKYLMVFDSPALGEIRELYNGKTSLVQADYGVDRNLYENTDTSRVELFSAVFNTLDSAFPKALKYEGIFDIEGRKRHVISGKSPTGYDIGLSFDVETKMLVTYSQPGALFTLSDYRMVDGVVLPFEIDMDGQMKVRLSSLVLNTKLDPATFEKREKCFDKPN